MKKKIIFLCIIAMVIIIGVSIYMGKENYEYIIPNDYIKKVENHMSYVDGEDEDIYIYNDKIIVETNIYYPVGAPYSYTRSRIITVYKGINDVNKINGSKGKIVYKKNK